VLIKLRPDAKGQRLNLERLIKVIGARGDASLVPPASIKLDLRGPGVRGVRLPPSHEASADHRSLGRGGQADPLVRQTTTGKVGPRGPKPAPSWWTARATAGEVTAGFTKEEILKPPKEDPGAEDGVFARVRGLLSELRVQ
jgi:hypothetical protein